MAPDLTIPVAQLGPPAISSPLPLASEAGKGCARFVCDGTWVREKIDRAPGEADDPGRWFEKAGPRPTLFFDPAKTRAAIVTCGGLCPGLNNVIRSLFIGLHYNYGVPEVMGLRNGYAGLNLAEGPSPIVLSSDFVDRIQYEGGTMLGTSRGPQEVGVMADSLVQRQIDILFCVGGDGTLRGAHALAAELQRRNLPIAVVSVPKTIDNDIALCDRTFGYFTALEKAREFIHQAHTEAKSVERGIGLVKLMGRHAGFIAAGAAIVSQQVNFALIPEIPFALEGPNGFLETLATRMDRRGHAVVVVAEGAGQNLFADEAGTDASGNRRLHDIGPLLKARISEFFALRQEPVDVKYIDPSYLVRSSAANMADSLLCDRLARNAVHAALAGKTDLVIGLWHNTFIHVPLALTIGQKRQVAPDGELWAAVLASTGQPARMGA